MAPIGQIYGYVGHPKVNRVLGAAAYNGVEVEVVETQAMKGDTKKPEYRALFPYGKIPGFKGSDGFTLIEGKAIARYGMYETTTATRFLPLRLSPASDHLPPAPGPVPSK